MTKNWYIPLVMPVFHSKHDQLCAALLSSIQDGSWPVGHRLPAERDLAAQFAVARPTLRLALSSLEQAGWLQRLQGRGTFVADPRRSRVHSRTVLVIADPVHIGPGSDVITDPFYQQMMAGVVHGLTPAGYDPVMYHAAGAIDRLIDAEGNVAVAAVILVTRKMGADFWRRIDDLAIPVVSIGLCPERSAQPTVEIDHVIGGYLAAKQLLATQRRRIAIFEQDGDSPQAALRRQGIERALREWSLEPVLWHPIVPWSEDSGVAAVQHLEDRHIAYDGIFVFGDWALYGVYQALQRAGKRVPDDVAIVLYDDYAWLERVLSPPPTAIRQPIQALGHAAAMQAVELITDGTFQRHQPIWLQPELFVRQSCGMSLV